MTQTTKALYTLVHLDTPHVRKVWKTLSAEKKATNGWLMQRTRISRHAVWTALQALRRAGMITTQIEGGRIHYIANQVRGAQIARICKELANRSERV